MTAALSLSLPNLRSYGANAYRSFAPSRIDFIAGPLSASCAAWIGARLAFSTVAEHRFYPCDARGDQSNCIQRIDAMRPPRGAKRVGDGVGGEGTSFAAVR
jgi:hypothetical protein